MALKIFGKPLHIEHLLKEIDLSDGYQAIENLRNKLSNCIIISFLPGMDNNVDEVDSLLEKLCNIEISQARSQKKKRSYAQLKLFFQIILDVLEAQGEKEPDYPADPEQVNAYKEYLTENFLPSKQVSIGNRRYVSHKSISDAAGLEAKEFAEICDNIMNFFRNDYINNPTNYVKPLQFKVDLINV